MALTYTEPTDISLLDPQRLAAHLQHTLEAALPGLHSISEEAASVPREPGKWSRKQILGHLIDSAMNNHQRFVRLQLEPTLHLPGYQQEGWVAVQHYSERSWSGLITLWSTLNQHIVHVLAYMQRDALGHVWKWDEGDVTLGFIAEDYIAHIEHHLRQIFS
ncbi:MAG: DinB family protein [Acidobacteriaceae bacterium]